MTKTKQQWEAEMKRLNSKYNLDCFLDSELDSESDEGEQYQYEHGYETHLKSTKMLKMSKNFAMTSFLKCNLLTDFLKNI